MSGVRTVLLNDICNFEKGSTGLMKAIPGEYPMVATGAERRTCESYQFNTKAVCIPLVSSTGHGHASLNYVHYQEGKFALGTILVAVTAKNEEELDVHFLHLYLSQLKDVVLVPLMKGGANVSLSLTAIKGVEIPLPSFIRQKEIVKKFKSIVVEEKELINELKKQKTLVDNLRRELLVDITSGKLTNEWRKAHNNIEPAHELLERITVEKNQIIKDRGLQRQKILIPIKDEEKQFELPVNWCWCKLGNLVLMNYGKGLTKSQTATSGDYAVYGSNGIVGYYHLGLTDTRAIIIGRKGSAGAIQVSNTGSWTTDVSYYIEESKELNFEYLVFLLTSLNLVNLGKGIKPGLNRDEAYNLIVALPPVPEQHEIIKKIEKINSICNLLESKLTDSKTYMDELMRAVLTEAFNKR